MTKSCTSLSLTLQNFNHLNLLSLHESLIISASQSVRSAFICCSVTVQHESHFGQVFTTFYPRTFPPQRKLTAEIKHNDQLASLTGGTKDVDGLGTKCCEQTLTSCMMLRIIRKQYQNLPHTHTHEQTGPTYLWTRSRYLWTGTMFELVLASQESD